MKKIFASVLVFIFSIGQVMAADFIETRNHYFEGKQFRVLGVSDWQGVGFGGDKINLKLQKYPEALKKYQNAQLNWMVGVAGYTASIVMVTDLAALRRRDFSYLIPLIIGSVGVAFGYADEQEAVIIYNDLEFGKRTASTEASITIATQQW
jgi:hypothetical protein